MRVVCFFFKLGLAIFVVWIHFLGQEGPGHNTESSFPKYVTHNVCGPASKVSFVCSQCTTIALAPRKRKIIHIKMIRWNGSEMALLLLRLLKWKNYFLWCVRASFLELWHNFGYRRMTILDRHLTVILLCFCHQKSTVFFSGLQICFVNVFSRWSWAKNVKNMQDKAKKSGWAAL